MHIHPIIKGHSLKPNFVRNRFAVGATDEIIVKITLHSWRLNSDIWGEKVNYSRHMQSPNLSYSQMFLVAFIQGQTLTEGGEGLQLSSQVRDKSSFHQHLWN